MSNPENEFLVRLAGIVIESKIQNSDVASMFEASTRSSCIIDGIPTVLFQNVEFRSNVLISVLIQVKEQKLHLAAFNDDDCYNTVTDIDGLPSKLEGLLLV